MKELDKLPAEAVLQCFNDELEELDIEDYECPPWWEDYLTYCNGTYEIE